MCLLHPRHLPGLHSIAHSPREAILWEAMGMDRPQFLRWMSINTSIPLTVPTIPRNPLILHHPRRRSTPPSAHPLKPRQQVQEDRDRRCRLSSNLSTLTILQSMTPRLLSLLDSGAKSIKCHHSLFSSYLSLGLSFGYSFVIMSVYIDYKCVSTLVCQ